MPWPNSGGESNDREEPRMTPERREWIKNRYGLHEEAAGAMPPVGGEEVMVHHGGAVDTMAIEPAAEWHDVEIDDGLLPGWRLQHVDLLGGNPPEKRAVYTRGEPGQEQILSVAIWECSSAKVARSFLIDLLDQFSSSRIKRLDGDEAIGDITLGHDQYMRLYVRGNLVVLVRNGGWNLVPAAEPTRELDARLIERSEAAGHG